MRSLRSKHVLVAGGAGFIGSHLVEQLAAEKPGSVTVVDQLTTGKRANLVRAREVCPSFTFYGADASDIGEMRQILERHAVDVVFNLAVIPLPASFERPVWTVRTNENIGISLLELLRQDFFRTLVHFSSSEAYGTCSQVPMTEEHPMRPSTPYAASKAATDLLIHSYVSTFGLDASILRPFNTFGPRQNARTYAGIIPLVIGRVLRGEPVEIHGDGEQTRDYLYVDDTVQAAIQFYRSDAPRGEAVNVSSGREINMNELVHKILHVLGAPDHPVFHVAPRPGDVRRHVGGNARALDAFGFKPTVSLDEGLAKTATWFREAIVV